MKIAHWNVGYNAQMSQIYEQLKNNLGDNFIAILLEMTPEKKEELLALFNNDIKYAYSLDYRKPGKFDGKNRKLGVLLLTSAEIVIEAAGVFERTLFPDRTLWANVNIDGQSLKIVGFHSITGCSHKTAKSTNFLSMAEAIDEYRPDILTMDANEPDVDHYDIRQMRFFEKNGRGAGIFFEEILNEGLVDAYAEGYNTENYEEGNPLAVSHVINGTGSEKRYDFVMIKPTRIKQIGTEYRYRDAINATADHAIVIVECSI